MHARNTLNPLERALQARETDARLASQLDRGAAPGAPVVLYDRDADASARGLALVLAHVRSAAWVHPNRRPVQRRDLDGLQRFLRTASLASAD